MLRERAEGLMRLCRLTKYTAASTAYVAWTAVVQMGRVETALMPSLFLFVAWMAFGPGWASWNRTCDQRPWWTAFRCAAHETAVVAICLLMTGVLPGAQNPSFPFFAGYVGAVFVILTALNRWLPIVMSRLMFRRSSPSRVLILGSPEATAALQERFSAADRLSIELITGHSAGAERLLRPYHPDTDADGAIEMSETLKHYARHTTDSKRIDEVAFICEDRNDTETATRQEIERLCDQYGLRLSVYFNGSAPVHRPRSQELGKNDFEAVRHEPLLNPLHQAAKHTVDILMAIPVVVVVLPPLCVAVRIVQWYQSPGPLLYRQKRCGKNGTSFRILKFRTMHVPEPGITDLEDNPAHRIYRGGTLLRESRLDEIPQFINVLLGSMSIVGPRAHHAQDRNDFSRLVPHYPMRLVVKPGITGLAQYREFLHLFHRGCIESRVQSDIEYISSWSLWMDLSLIVRSGRVIAESLLRSILRRPVPKSPLSTSATRIRLYPGASGSDKQAAQMHSAVRPSITYERSAVS